MSFDAVRYRDEVLPGLLARAERKDAIARYDLDQATERVPTPERLEAVAAIWQSHPEAETDQTLKLYRSQHGGIVGTPEEKRASFWNKQWKAAKASKQQSPAEELLRTMVQDARAAGRFVSTDQVESWVAAGQGSYDADRVRAVAAQAGLEVCDPPVLPVGSGLIGDDVGVATRAMTVLGVDTFLPVLFPEAQLTTLILRSNEGEETRLRWSSAPAAMVGTVPLAGGSAGGPEVLATARGYWSQPPATREADAATDLLQVLDRVRQDRGDAGIDELLWCQVVAAGRSRLRSGITGQKALTGELEKLHLDERSSELLAFALTTASTGGDPELKTVRDALSDGDVLLAEQRLQPFVGARATAEVTDLRADIQSRRDRHATLLDQAQALLDSDPERAGSLLTQAQGLIRDDHRADGLLARLAAPAVPAVRCTTGADGVRVSWDEPNVLYGSVTYRVVRGDRSVAPEDPAATVIAEGVSDLQLVDPSPPGHEVRYGVVTCRDGGRPAPLVIAPGSARHFAEVGQIHARVKGPHVHLSWSWPAGAKAVRVERSTRGSQPVPVDGAAADGLVDTSTEVGFEYQYRVSLCFDDHGESVWSPGAQVKVEVAAQPSPVGDLAADLGSDGYRLTWTRPTRGEVGVRRLDQEPAVGIGDEIPTSDLHRFGDRLDADTQTVGDRQSVTDRPSAGRWWYLPVTINGQLCVAGEWVAVSFVEPVSALRAKRRGDRVHVAWDWPTGATDARVEFAVGGDVTDTIELTQAEYRRANGVWHPIGPAPLDVSVDVVTSIGSGQQRSAPTVVAVAGTAITVGQKVKRRPLSTPALELSTIDPLFVPPIVVRYAEGTVGPTDRDFGTELLRIPGFGLPARGVRRVPLVGLPPNTTVSCFTEDPSLDALVRFVSALPR